MLSVTGWLLAGLELKAGTREKEVGDGGQDLTLTACLHFSSPSHSHRPSMSAR